MQRFPFRPNQRLHTPEQYDQVFSGKHSAGDNVLLVFVDQSGPGPAQLGTSVGKCCGNSVKRHQWKRHIREAFRLSQSQWIPGLRIVVVPRPGISASSIEIRKSFLTLVPRAMRKLTKKSGDSA